MQLCATRDVRRLSVGQVVYTAMCYPHGGMIDDGTVFRLGDNNFRWVGGNDLSGLWLREQAQQRGLDAWVKTSTDQLANVAVQGPKSREILERILWTGPTWQSIGELGWFRFSGRPPQRFPRHGPGRLPYRVHRRARYRALLPPQGRPDPVRGGHGSGRTFGIAPLGLGALDMLRIEAGLVFAGAEFSDRTDPFEAGIGFTVPLKSKAGDFIGREALARRKAHPVRKLVGLDLEGGLVPSAGDCCARRTRPGRGDHLRGALARPRQGHRALPHGRGPRGARHGGRGRPARRPPEAHPGPRRPLPALRPGDAAVRGDYG